MRTANTEENARGLWQQLKAVTVSGPNQLKVTPVESQESFNIQAFRCGAIKASTKSKLASAYWRRISETLGSEFNFQVQQRN
jgi:hypothetical protein